MNDGFLKKNYTGDGIIVAIIDTGVSCSDDNVKHAIYHDNTIKEEYCDVSDAHGTACYYMIKKIAPKVSIIDINVLGYNDRISEESIIKAIYYAVNEKADVISISLGLKSCSYELHEACNYAMQKDTIITASLNQSKAYLYPALINSVIKVSNINKHLDYGKGYFTKVPLKRICFHISECKYSFCGISISTAYYSGLLALFLESRPLISHNDALKSIFLKYYSEDIKTFSTDKDFKKSIALLLDSPLKCLQKFRSIIEDDIVCTQEDGSPIDIAYLHSNTTDIKSLLIINASENCKQQIKALQNLNPCYIGDFVNTNSNLVKMNINKKKELLTTPVPIVLISSFGPNMSKLQLQLELTVSFNFDGYDTQCISYNALGTILKNHYSFEYPKNISTPEMVYSINFEFQQFLKRNSNLDLFIVNVGGGICRLNDSIDNDFGCLVNAYLTALAVDVFILCTNIIVSENTIIRVINLLISQGISNIIVVISDICYDPIKLDSSSTIRYFPADKEKILNYRNKMQKKIGIPVFTEEEVENKLLYKYVLSLFE